MGDGNEKCNRLVCYIPIEMYHAMNYKRLQQSLGALELTQKEYQKCPNKPYAGNQNAKKFLCCLDCAMKLTYNGIHPDDVDLFITWRHSVDKMYNLLTAGKKVQTNIAKIQSLQKAILS